jgi:glycosyltransferase involved in cell wall biosynthesis
MPSLSVVIPIKDEQDNLPRLHERLRQALDPLVSAGTVLDRYEVLFVDDGSKDASFALLQELAADPRVKVVQLRRNFGQSAALRAGIDWSSGDIIVTMDGVLQNDRRTIRPTSPCSSISSPKATTPSLDCVPIGRTVSWCARCPASWATGSFAW